MLTTFSADPDADILTAANRNTDVIHLAVDFNLLTARPARTMSGRVGGRIRSTLASGLQRVRSQKLGKFHRGTRRSKRLEKTAAVFTSLKSLG